MSPYQTYIAVCEELAAQAKENGNAPVGAVIVKDGKIIAQGIEAGNSKADITCHAEMEAIRNARAILGKDLSDCILVSTHEPCIMCGYAIRFHKINTVVFQQAVQHLGSITSSMAILTSNEVPPHWAKPPQIIHLKK